MRWRSPVTGASWSSPGRDGIAVLDNETGAVRTLGTPADRFTSVAISPDQRLVAAGSAGHAVHIWELAGAALRTLHGFVGSGVLVSFSPDGQLLAAAGSSDRAARIFPVPAERSSLAAHRGRRHRGALIRGREAAGHLGP